MVEPRIERDQIGVADDEIVPHVVRGRRFRQMNVERVHLLTEIGCDVDRFAESIERRPGLIRRIFTPAEAERPMASKAARFAAKEALAKALGAPDGLSWLDAEVVTDDHGKPSFKIMGTVAARAAELGIGTIHLSMSHDAGIASAVVICEA